LIGLRSSATWRPSGRRASSASRTPLPLLPPPSGQWAGRRAGKKPGPRSRAPLLPQRRSSWCGCALCANLGRQRAGHRAGHRPARAPAPARARACEQASRLDGGRGCDHLRYWRKAATKAELDIPDGTRSRGEPVNHLENPGNSCWPHVNHLRKPWKLVALPFNHLERKSFGALRQCPAVGCAQRGQPDYRRSRLSLLSGVAAPPAIR
jgi:hypothetical protein